MDPESLRRVLNRVYSAECTLLLPLAQGANDVLLVDAAGHSTPWVVRVLATDADAYFTDSFLSAAHVLAFLEEQGYPAERLIRTRDGETVGLVDGLRLMVTIYEGTPLRSWQGESFSLDGFLECRSDIVNQIPISSADYYELGMRSGSLHSLPLKTSSRLSPLPTATTLPQRDLVWVAEYLAARSGDVPTNRQAEYETLLANIRSTDTCEGLPITLLHSDVHPDNAVRTPDRGVILVDWEGAGLGSAIVDLGLLLDSCFDDNYRPDTKAIAAVVDGYSECRLPSGPEVQRLPDATRFRTLVHLGGYFFSGPIIAWMMSTRFMG